MTITTMEVFGPVLYTVCTVINVSTCFTILSDVIGRFIESKVNSRLAKTMRENKGNFAASLLVLQRKADEFDKARNAAYACLLEKLKSVNFTAWEVITFRPDVIQFWGTPTDYQPTRDQLKIFKKMGFMEAQLGEASDNTVASSEPVRHFDLTFI